MTPYCKVLLLKLKYTFKLFKKKQQKTNTIVKNTQIPKTLTKITMKAYIKKKTRCLCGQRKKEQRKDIDM